jgi:hypothetical protein
LDDKRVVLDGVERLNRLVASFILPDLAAAFEQLQTKVLSWFHYCSKLNYWKKMFWPFSAYCFLLHFDFQKKHWNTKMLKITVQKSLDTVKDA